MFNQNKNHSSIFFAGHFAIDNIIRYKIKSKPSLGGSVSYCSLALRTYTQDVNISIISHIGKSNFDEALLNDIRKKKIDLKGVKYSEKNNTNFILDYFDHIRTLTLKSRSPNLDFKNVPQYYIDYPPEIIVLVPLCNEISYDFVSQVLKHFPNVYIGIDLQGFLRKIDEDGKVFYIYDEKIISNMTKIINLIGDKLVLKGSEEEMKLLVGEIKDLYKVMKYFNNYRINGLFIMTLGEKGSMIIKHGEEILKIPAFKPKKVIDETGAGDIYFSIFLYEYLQSDKTWKAVKNAAYLASAAASFLIEKKGPNGFETKKKVLRRVKREKYIDL